MQEFFAMGGYGAYVWSAFGISAFILLINLLQPVLQHRQAIRDADDFHHQD
ncbi:heme exporter protein CcmD [Thiomicrorhabdus sp.]|uniref:heme exporter protein CcmD n=1 Tax=Thiomicrorhabdus sp. TaxID=2039724 RepID=UPI0029C6FCFD|nr:heme exporter protein CcmD [Thiomicrorhabdus sp.]